MLSAMVAGSSRTTLLVLLWASSLARSVINEAGVLGEAWRVQMGWSMLGSAQMVHGTRRLPGLWAVKASE